MLIDWMLSTMPENNRECELTKSIIHQVCSGLLNAKIINLAKEKEPAEAQEEFNVRLFEFSNVHCSF